MPLEMRQALVFAAKKGTATVLQVALTYGTRAREICILKWTDLNTWRMTISINDVEMGSRNRTIKVPAKTIAMITALSRKHGLYIFNPDRNALG